MKKFITQRWFKITAIIVIIACSIGGFSYYYFQTSGSVICDFDEKRDSAFILDIFEKDRYWLTASPDYSPEFMLQNRASSQNPADKGNLTIKVAYDNGKPVGFISYFVKKFYLGRILMIDVKSEYRRKGYAYQLLDYAIKDLKSRGCTIIRLVTRTTNYSAQALYKKFGFHETYRDEGYVHFEYRIP